MSNQPFSTTSSPASRRTRPLLPPFRQRIGQSLTQPIKSMTAAICAMALLNIMGCAGASVAVLSSELPVPLMQPLDVNLGIQLSDELLAYEHTEDLKKNGKWRIELGSAQSLMFDNLAQGMFTEHEIITGNSGSTSDIDAILIPNIKQLQFAIPSQTKGDFFEVWIEYEFQLTSPEGAQIAQFPLTAYGKANSRDFGFLEDTENGALGQAAKVALRDAMAFFALRFKRHPQVAQWLATGTVPAPTTPAPAPPAGTNPAQPNQPAGPVASPAQTQQSANLKQVGAPQS